MNSILTNLFRCVVQVNPSYNDKVSHQLRGTLGDYETVKHFLEEPGLLGFDGVPPPSPAPAAPSPSPRLTQQPPPQEFKKPKSTSHSQQHSSSHHHSHSSAQRWVLYMQPVHWVRVAGNKSRGGSIYKLCFWIAISQNTFRAKELVKITKFVCNVIKVPPGTPLNRPWSR